MAEDEAKKPANTEEDPILLAVDSWEVLTVSRLRRGDVFSTDATGVQAVKDHDQQGADWATIAADAYAIGQTPQQVGSWYKIQTQNGELTLRGSQEVLRRLTNAPPLGSAEGEVPVS